MIIMLFNQLIISIITFVKQTFYDKNITLFSESGIFIESLQNGTDAYTNIIIQNGYLIIKPQVSK